MESTGKKSFGAKLKERLAPLMESAVDTQKKKRRKDFLNAPRLTAVITGYAYDPPQSFFKRERLALVCDLHDANDGSWHRFFSEPIYALPDEGEIFVIDILAFGYGFDKYFVDIESIRPMNGEFTDKDMEEFMRTSRTGIVDYNDHRLYEVYGQT